MHGIRCSQNKMMATQQSRLLLLIPTLIFSAFHFEITSAFDCPNSKTAPLVVKRKRFYDSSTDEYVPIKGIAYYPRPNEGPLSDGNSIDFYTDEFSSRWTEDIRNMKDLGINAVRLYAVDPSANHDSFMCALSEAGIYVVLGLGADCEGCAIGAWVGVDAEPPSCYSSSLKERGRFVIRSFSKYDNLMAFSAGNEVSIYADDGAGGPREANVPCQKKFLRDMREYVTGCTWSSDSAVLPRKVPIGVVNWDGNSQSFEQHYYYNCRTNPNDPLENAEWFALNSYRHCDGSATSIEDLNGWLALQADFREANFPGPVLLGEYGCREQGFPEKDGFETQRTWLQTDALYTPEYSDVFAGGFVFEYSTERKKVDANLQFLADRQGLDEPTSEWPYDKFAKVNYGIGYFGPSDCQHNATTNANLCEYSKYPEWDDLAKAYARSDEQTVRAQSPGTIPKCPDRFPPLSFFDWPTDEGDDPELDYCLELKNKVLETGSPTDPATDAPTALPTEQPSASTNDDIFTFRTDAPTTSTAKDVTTSLPSETPSISTTDAFTTARPMVSPTVSPTVSTAGASSYPTMEDFTTAPTTSISSFRPTDDQNAQCFFHSQCAAVNLTGTCCPTSDGVVLGCCDNFLEETDENAESSANTTVVYYFFIAIYALTVLFLSL